MYLPAISSTRMSGSSVHTVRLKIQGEVYIERKSFPTWLKAKVYVGRKEPAARAVNQWRRSTGRFFSPAVQLKDVDGDLNLPFGKKMEERQRNFAHKLDFQVRSHVISTCSLRDCLGPNNAMARFWALSVFVKLSGARSIPRTSRVHRSIHFTLRVNVPPPSAVAIQVHQARIVTVMPNHRPPLSSLPQNSPARCLRASRSMSQTPCTTQKTFSIHFQAVSNLNLPKLATARPRLRGDQDLQGIFKASSYLQVCIIPSSSSLPWMEFIRFSNQFTSECALHSTLSSCCKPELVLCGALRFVESWWRWCRYWLNTGSSVSLAKPMTEVIRKILIVRTEGGIGLVSMPELAPLPLILGMPTILVPPSPLELIPVLGS
ncbi:hypothetical protein C8F04DRAFT_1196946 [Mycena alexandri]|uniref:Uncharacterized protein n=1 Tax=Mycena alexandri TaxID=1745969 RepID=A0AAD6S2T0_9AGAR|nr:hypothetical protein C8F04DRAFT_1196946 [Mycena alexandri]